MIMTFSYLSKRFLLALLCCSPWVFGAHPIFAAEHIIHFDELTEGDQFGVFQPYGSGTEQIHILGSSESIPTVVDPATGTITNPHALLLDYDPGPEMPDSGMEYIDIRLTGFTTDSASVCVGMIDNPRVYTVTAYMRGYQTVGGIPMLVAQDSLNLESSPVAPSNLRQLSIASPDGAIDTIRISYGDDSYTRELIDNLRIHVWEGDEPPPPPEDTDPPVLQITDTFPDDGHGSVVSISGRVTEETALASVRAQTPSGTYEAAIWGEAPDFHFVIYAEVPAVPTTCNITVTAEDGNGNTDSDVFAYRYSPPEPPPPPAALPDTLDFEARGMEVTQAIQGWEIMGVNPSDGEMHQTRLIAGKKTLVRVFGEVLGSDIDIPGVDCRLSASVGGVELEGSPIYARNRITLSPGEDHLIQRPDPQKGFVFVLPPEWTIPGSVRLRATVNPWNGVMERPGKNNALNEAVTDVSFYDTRLPLHLRVYRVQSTSEGDVRPTRAECIENIEMMRRFYPVPPQKFHVNWAGRVITDIPISDSDYDLYRFKRYFRRALGLSYSRPVTWQSHTVFLALTHNSVRHRGVTDSHFPVSVSCARHSSENNFYFYQVKTAHEAGHALGLGHVQGCKDPTGPYEPYPTYEEPYEPPFSGADYWPPSIGDYGTNILPDNSFNIVRPEEYGDLMSYCGSRYMSLYSWEWLANKFDAFLPDARTAAQYEVSDPTTESRASLDSYMIVTGVIYPDGEGDLDPAWTNAFAAGTYDYIGTGSCTLQLKTALGKVLFTRYFDPKPVVDLEDYLEFEEIVPYMPGAFHIELSGPCVKKAVRLSSGLAFPEVRIQAPQSGARWKATGNTVIDWTAYDADKEALTSTVLYSHDSGKHWQVLAGDLRTTALEIDLSYLPGGQNSCMIRVVATDGIHTGSADSGLFSKESLPPEAAILSPMNLNHFKETDTVIFESLVSDREDGSIPEHQISWYSDIDGLLGTGTVIGARNLSAGRHEIILTAKDSDGSRSEDRITIIVPLRRGDINGDIRLDLKDAILSLQISVGGSPKDIRTDYFVADVDYDKRIGLPEAIYCLRKMAELE